MLARQNIRPDDAGLIFRSSSSTGQCRPIVSEEIVTLAQSLVGIVWLMVSIFAPHWAKMVSIDDSRPGISRRII